MDLNYGQQFRGMIPLREALAESSNAVAIWLTEEIGVDSVLGTSRSLGVKTRLQSYPTTARGASEVNLLELANAYRTIASGIFAEPFMIRKIVRDSGEVAVDSDRVRTVEINDPALILIQEGLRGVVRMPNGTAHKLLIRAISRSPSWARRGRPMSSGMRSLSARRSVPKGSPSLYV